MNTEQAQTQGQADPIFQPLRFRNVEVKNLSLIHI